MAGEVRMGGVSIMFRLDPELASRVRGHQHWINADDVEELYRDHCARGAKIASELEDKPWGFREYSVEDPNGYELRFTGSPSHDAPRSRPFPEGVSLERRKYTLPEYVEMAGAAFGFREAGTEILENTWGGIIARLEEGTVIGGLRIMWDAPGWFSIWDVAVVPDWQGQSVGSAMMKDALSLIRETAPGAHVYLFTSKHGFYERLGFATETVTMLRV